MSCTKCPRLIQYIARVAEEKVRRYKEWRYWGTPLPGFGDVDARLVIIGLAPAAHGGNRTGRMFTGDSSGDWLMKALYHEGWSNQVESRSREDGLKLCSTFITAALRCAPPGNTPTSQELDNCAEYLREELQLLKNVSVVLVLGRIAFHTYVKYVYPKSEKPKPRFQRGKIYRHPGRPVLVVSYHPSRQNTQTGRLTWDMWTRIFKQVQQILEQTES